MEYAQPKDYPLIFFFISHLSNFISISLILHLGGLFPLYFDHALILTMHKTYDAKNFDTFQTCYWY